MIGRVLRYLRTARHLTPRQWLYFPLRRLQAGRRVRLGAAHPANARFIAAPTLVATLRALGPRGDDSAARADGVLGGTFRFVGRRASRDTLDWNGEHLSRLWTYNLHYFDYAHDLARAYVQTGDRRYADGFAALALEWIDATSDECGPGWEPYTASVRAVNWTHAVLLLGDALDATAHDRITRSIHRQLRWLEHRLEWHVLANHLLRNLQALAIGSLAFEGRDADRWQNRFLPMLWDQVLEQVSEDGGHYERSPMYHVVALCDFLEIIALCRSQGVAVPVGVTERVASMLNAADVLCRPDGSLHLFNDSAHGIAPPVSYARRLGDRLGIADGTRGSDSLPLTGYWLYHDQVRGDRLVVDCGGASPAYQPGHTHCDILSYELDLAGRPVVIDSGLHGYDGDPYREYVRSTRAHNTVSVDGREQFEVWGTFRVARRARVRGASATLAADWSFSGAYSPYYDNRVVHARRIACRPGDVTVTDEVRGARDRYVESFIHLHPDFVVSVGDGVIAARSDGMTVRIEPFGIDAVTIHRGETEPVQGWSCPEFGHAVPAPVVRLRIMNYSGGEFGYRIIHQR